MNSQSNKVETARGGSGRGVKLALGIAISAIFLYATFRAVPFGAVADVLSKVDAGWIAAALGSIALAYLLKIYRWTTMLRGLGAEIRIGDATTPFLGGVAFNNVLPFRAGDVIRVVAFERFTGIPPSGQIGTLVLERLLDLLVLITILFATITLWQVDVLDEALLAGLRVAALAVAFAILVFIAAPKPIRMVVKWAEGQMPKLAPAGQALLRLSDAVRTLSRPLFLVRVIAISFLAWLAEGGAFFAVGQALGVGVSLEAALLALCVGTLSTIIPSSPGYVGTFHYFTARVVSSFGVGQVDAAAYAILIHALLWLMTTASGFLLLAFSSLGARRAVAASEVGGAQ